MYPKVAKFAVWSIAVTFVIDIIFLLISNHFDYRQNIPTATALALLLGFPLRHAYQYVTNPVGKAIAELKFVDDQGLAALVQPLLNDTDSDVRVGRYESPELNAVAISSVFGNKSAIAFSTGLISKASPDQFRAIAAHEVAHIKHTDSKNKSYILAFHHIVNFYPAVIAHLSRELLSRVIGLFLFIAIVMFLVIVKTYDAAGILAALNVSLPVLTPILILLVPIFIAYLINRATDLFFFHYSRQREFAADAEGAVMTSMSAMKRALQLLSDGEGSKTSLFDTHPPIEERLNRLELNAESRRSQG